MKKLWILPIAAMMMVACGGASALEDAAAEMEAAVEEAAEEMEEAAEDAPVEMESDAEEMEDAA